MNVEEVRNYCISKKSVKESLPFDNFSLVFKVGDKIFAILSLDEVLSINLKCEPEKAIELRENYPSVLPGYHMNKLHWNTIMIDDTINDKNLCEWIDDSYDLIVKSFTKKQRLAFENL